VTLKEPQTHVGESPIRSHTVKKEHGGGRGCSVKMNEGMTKTHRQMEAERQTSLVGLDPAPLDPTVMSRHQELETEAVLDGVVCGIPAADPARLCHGMLSLGEGRCCILLEGGICLWWRGMCDRLEVRGTAT
jgi:hypothetical protein